MPLRDCEIRGRLDFLNTRSLHFADHRFALICFGRDDRIEMETKRAMRELEGFWNIATQAKSGPFDFVQGKVWGAG